LIHEFVCGFTVSLLFRTVRHALRSVNRRDSTNSINKMEERYYLRYSTRRTAEFPQGGNADCETRPTQASNFEAIACVLKLHIPTTRLRRLIHRLM